MAKSKNINGNSCFEESHVKRQNIDNLFLSIYINNFVKKLRSYSSDELFINMSGIEKFINKEDITLNYLFEQLKENKFTVEFNGNDESINYIDTTCRNIKTGLSDNFRFQIQSLPTIVELSSKTDIPVAGIIIMKIVAQIITRRKILYKAIVLDLDDTLWKGTLSEDGINKIKENMYSEQGAPFITFMKFIKTLANEVGIFIAICSRNDSKLVEATIKELDDSIFPLKDQVDYIIANNNDKSDNIKRIADQLSILTQSIVFIDDNQIVRDEVKFKLPEVFVPEWTNHNELVTQLIVGCIFERDELSLNSQFRRKQYKIIQTERNKNCLPTLSVRVINDDKHIESTKLYSKSNQFKFSRNDDNFDDNTKSLYFEILRTNGENLGICAAITYNLSYNTLYIQNWAISCRYFEMGLEEFILLEIQKIANTHKTMINYQYTAYNQKVSELLAKYSYAFLKSDKLDVIEIKFTKKFTDNINKNTNLIAI